MRRAMLVATMLLGGCSACDFHVEGDKTRMDDLTERVMKLEKRADEADANFKAVAQFAGQTKKSIEDLSPKPPPKLPAPTPGPSMSPAP